MKKNQKRLAHTNKNINIIHNRVDKRQGSHLKKQIVTRNYGTALILSIFLGFFGIDRFYVNHVGLGLLKLFTLGFAGFWWLIDIILFATKNINYVRWE